MRTADVDAYGQALNSYSGRERRTSSPAPDRPWAMYLSDAAQQYRYLAFDLDASKAGAGAAAADTETILDLLGRLDIAAVVCQSGPNYGRHVWVAFTDGVDAADVDRLAKLLPSLCPSLDLAPWNTTKGCVRPPGAPHRNGGASTVIRGTIDVLTRPTTTPQQFAALVDAVATASPAVAAAPTPLPQIGRTIAVDADGHRYLPGSRRDLPTNSRAALALDAAAGDASAVLWRVLCGAAAAHWHVADVARLVDEPGMEHVRTRHHQGTRIPRPENGSQSAQKVLEHHWDRAIRYVVSTPRRTGSDAAFDARAYAVTQHTESVQTRANAAPGRWGSGGGPADRRIFDTLCALAVEAVTATVEADIRRLGLLAGIGSSTAARALQRLASDGWIAPARSADGVHAAHWTIDPRNVLHRESESNGTQAATRPEGAGAEARTVLLRTLQARLADHTHDLFTGRGALPLLAGNLYAHTHTGTSTPQDLATSTGASLADVDRTTDRLVQLGVLMSTPTGWTRPRTDHRDAAARALDVDGRLNARRRRFETDRQLWVWWQGEHARMAGSSTYRTARRHVQVAQLWRNPNEDYYPRHPRRADGRADYAAARAYVEAGAIDTALPVATIAA